jgi:pimeloyl-ACP methyl ester carboxylesterase
MKKAIFFMVLGGLLVWAGGQFLQKSNAPTSEESKPEWDSAFQKVEITSPLDGHVQPAYFYATQSQQPQPLIVSLHTWSYDYTQYDSLNQFALETDINYIHPNFRGPNNHTKACCSEFVLSDIDAAIDYALEHANVDTNLIYVVGKSGGGYATLAMFMKSRHQIHTFSSWVPLCDLVQWYEDARIRKLDYAKDVLACTQSTGDSLNRKIALERSPYYWPTPVDKLQESRLEIYTGIYDGMTGNGTIPITHAYRFYNKVLADLGVTDSSAYVTETEKLALLEDRKPLDDFGSIGGRKVALVKEYGNIKLTLFLGGHEMLRKFAFRELIQ